MAVTQKFRFSFVRSPQNSVSIIAMNEKSMSVSKKKLKKKVSIKANIQANLT